jgi:hypothetical protein
LIELLLFDDENTAQPAKVIPLDPNQHAWSMGSVGINLARLHIWDKHVPVVMFRCQQTKTRNESRKSRKSQFAGNDSNGRLGSRNGGLRSDERIKR